MQVVGNGIYTKRLLTAGAEVKSVDFSQPLLNIAMEDIFNLRSDNGSFIQANLGGLPFPDNYFNKILNNLTLMWMSDCDLEDFVAESYRVLKNGGRLVTSFLHPETNKTKLLKYNEEIVRNASGKLQRVAKFDPKQEVRTWQKRINGTSFFFTYHNRTLEEYLQLFTESGFVVDEIKEPVLPKEVDIGSRTEERQTFPEFVVIAFSKEYERKF